LHGNGPPPGRARGRDAQRAGLSAALDPRGVLEDAATAVLRLGDERLTALLDREVPGAGREFGDRGRRTVLREQRPGHRHGEPERREVTGGRSGRLPLRLAREGLLTGLARLRLTTEGRLLRRTRVAVTAGRLRTVGLRGRGTRGRDERTLQGGHQRGGDRRGGQQQRRDQTEDETGTGVRLPAAETGEDVVERPHRVDDRPEGRPRGEDRQGHTELAEVETGDLGRLGQRAGHDDEGRTGDTGDVHAHHQAEVVPGVGDVVAVAAERVEERRDEQQYRCSDHHAVASSEGADIHFRSFVGRLVVGRGVAVHLVALRLRCEARG